MLSHRIPLLDHRTVAYSSVVRLIACRVTVQLRNEKFAPWCTKSRVKHDDRIMMWKCFLRLGSVACILYVVLDNEMFLEYHDVVP